MSVEPQTIRPTRCNQTPSLQTLPTSQPCGQHASPPLLGQGGLPGPVAVEPHTKKPIYAPSHSPIYLSPSLPPPPHCDDTLCEHTKGNHCVNTHPAPQVPSLHQLNLYGCRRASGPQLQVVLDSLTHLAWASFNGCAGIQSLYLTRKQGGQAGAGCVFIQGSRCLLAELGKWGNRDKILCYWVCMAQLPTTVQAVGLCTGHDTEVVSTVVCAGIC